MHEENIFTPDPGAAPTTVVVDPTITPVIQTPAPVATVIPPELAALIGEGKKYASLDEVHKAFPNAQTHIATIESENALLKKDLAERKSAEELLQEIRTASTPTDPVVTPTPVDISPDVIAQVVDKQLAARKTEDIANANTAMIVDTFRQTYGEKAQASFTQLAVDNDMTITQLNAMVAQYPKAVLRLSGLTAKAATPNTTINSDVNTQKPTTNINTTVLTSQVPLYANSKDLGDGWNKAKAIVEARKRT